MRLYLTLILTIGLITLHCEVNAIPEKNMGRAERISTRAVKAPLPHEVVAKDARRLVMPIDSARGTPQHTGRLIVMFDPNQTVRAPRTASNELFSLNGVDLAQSTALLAKYGATIRQAINADPVMLADLRSRAESRSNKPMPDLASMMYLEGIAPSQLLGAAREFLALGEVVWVEIEAKTQLSQGTPYCASCGAGQGCTSLPCNYPHPGTVTVGGGPVGYCSDQATCTLVITIRPGCATSWDEVCATLANLLGPSAFGGASTYDTCLQPQSDPPPPFNQPWSPLEESLMLQTSPFIAHTIPGSINSDCCRAVCFEDVTCCTIAWDADCASLAIGFYDDCYSTAGYTVPGGSGNPQTPNPQAPSPLFDATMLEEPPPPEAAPGSAPLALYTTAQRAPNPYTGPNPPPADFGPFTTFASVTGFRGGGIDIDAIVALLEQFPGTNGPQLSRIKIALVEPSALVNHEDLIDPVTGLTKITVESGQTPLIINDQTSPPPTFSGSFDTAPAHGTASLGVLFANANSIGVTGIVPDADAYFFPTESFEENGRTLTAMTNAVNLLSAVTSADPNPGNIIVMPVAELNQPLNTVQSRATIIEIGLGLGVTFVLAAGNGAQEVNAPITGTDLAIVVGGVWPGFQAIVAPPGATVYPIGLNYCRTGISNYSTRVTVSGWGSGVCTLGYGDLFCGTSGPVSTNPAVAQYEVNRLRSYTAAWGGTSAATAQIGGVVGLIQALAKQVYEGQPFSPENMNELLRDPNNIYPQCGLTLNDRPGFITAGYGDTVSNGTQAPVAGFPNMRRLGVSTINGDFYDGNQSTFKIVCGTLVSGTQFSIRDSDQKYVKARTARPRGSQSSSGLGPPLVYPPSARILDVQVIRTTDLAVPADLERVSVSVTGRASSVGSALVMVFLYDGAMNRWKFLPPFAATFTTVDQTLQFTIGACATPASYAYSDGGVKMAARVVVFPLGGLGQTQIWLDQVLINYNSDLILVPPPCP
ncbi:MAG: hypothetical protein EXS17_00165 [Phycisphaerales bacterium]|nr:hypothetical protein [Phycisphaerales bacterium]